ncbi:MAG: hypothetical protein O2897_00945 [bacterium]|nr:hypothetical protein [bacterium]
MTRRHEILPKVSFEIEASVKHLYNEYRQYFEPKEHEVVHYFLYQEGQEATIPGYLEQLIYQITDLISFNTEGLRIHAIGFICNPIGCEEQSWHIDFHRDDYILGIIPLTKFTINNTIGVLELKHESDYQKVLQNPENFCLDQFEHEIISPILNEFEPLIINSAIHRRGKNTDDFVRRFLFFTLYPKSAPDIPSDKTNDFNMVTTPDVFMQPIKMNAIK